MDYGYREQRRVSPLNNTPLDNETGEIKTEQSISAYEMEEQRVIFELRHGRDPIDLAG
jgi:hypothetical protein